MAIPSLQDVINDTRRRCRDCLYWMPKRPKNNDLGHCIVGSRAGDRAEAILNFIFNAEPGVHKNGRDSCSKFKPENPWNLC